MRKVMATAAAAVVATLAVACAPPPEEVPPPPGPPAQIAGDGHIYSFVLISGQAYTSDEDVSVSLAASGGGIYSGSISGSSGPTSVTFTTVGHDITQVQFNGDYQPLSSVAAVTDAPRCPGTQALKLSFYAAGALTADLWICDPVAAAYFG